MSKEAKTLSLLVASLLLSTQGQAHSSRIVDYNKLDTIWSVLVQSAQTDYQLLIDMIDSSKQELEKKFNYKLTKQEYLIIQELIDKLLCGNVDVEIVHIQDLPLSTQEFFRQ